MFRPTLGTAAAMLAAMGALQARQVTVEHYVSLPGRTGLAIKLRNAGLELKTLLDVVDGLQLWEPTARVPLPATGGDLAAITRQVGVALPKERRFPDAAALAKAVRQFGFDIVRLRKVRRLYSLGEIRAEITAIRTPSHRCLTLAAESGDPAALAGLVRRLGFQQSENTSYPAFVGGIASAASPQESDLPSPE